MTSKRPSGSHLLAVLCALSSVKVETAETADLAPLGLLDAVHLSTARDDFNGNNAAFDDAIAWHGERLYQSGSSGAHVACAKYGGGLQARSSLGEFLSPECMHPVSNHKVYGTCFILTVSPTQAAKVAERPAAHGLCAFFALPSAVKLAPGLLHHGSSDARESERLQTTYGNRTTMTNNVYGLGLTLSPGVLAANGVSEKDFITALQESLMSATVDLHAANFWSDPTMLKAHNARPEGALRAREWTRAADVVHQLSFKEGPTPGEICSWNDISILRYYHGDGLIVTGIDHLLPDGRGAGGTDGEEAEELKVACFMGLVSFLASAPEVLRVSPLHRSKLHNAVAASVIQAGTIDTSQKPLTEAGLDGTDEVIQIVDSGLDETHCFFIDEDGEEVEHGYLFDEVGVYGPSSSEFATMASGGYFPFDLSRRKIVQYIRLVAPDPIGDAAYFYTSNGAGPYQWFTSSGFGADTEDGHGTHTAGSAAGAPLNDPAVPDTCTGTDTLGCIGGCLNTSYVTSLIGNLALALVPDFDTWCPQFECDGYGADTEPCLDEDVSATLTENAGMASGAKLAIFDVSFDGQGVWASVAVNALWEATEDTGCMLHSNSWGSDSYCTTTFEGTQYDQYMYENPEHLLLFAAGNDGDLIYESERAGICTIGSQGLSKNVLTVGASSSGITRLTRTDANRFFYGFGSTLEFADIDTVAAFSSYGGTADGRVKPDVVAPGDQVLSAGSDGTDDHSCQLYATQGTSMSCPIVAGAAAMIRQYFKDDTFYVNDLNSRGLCGASTAFACEGFSPYAATVKAMLINSADLMGGSAEPDGLRGFGRIYLEGGMPLEGSGDMALFVADAADHSIEENSIHRYSLDVNSDTGVDMRVTLAWIDPSASETASIQLVHDLDLTVVSPGGVEYRMWGSVADPRNVVERVIISSDDIDSDNAGDWVVEVSSESLTESSQPYSLVVTGPIAGVTTTVAENSAASAIVYSVGLARAMALATTATTALVLAAAMWTV